MEIQGLPLHILLLHLTVVIAPAAAVTAIVYAGLRRTRRYLAWPLGVGAVLTAGSALLTAHFGEELESALKESEAIEQHALFGDIFKYVAVLFLLGVVFLLVSSVEQLDRVTWLQWSRKLRTGATPRRVALFVVMLLSVTLIVLTVLTGHSGAAAVWQGWRRER